MSKFPVRLPAAPASSCIVKLVYGFHVVAFALALVTVGVATLVNPAGVGAAPSGPDESTTSLIPGVAEVDVDAFWAERFATVGFAYASAGIIGFDAPVATGCGTVDPSAYLSFYCTTDWTVYYSTSRFDRVAQTYGDAAWISVVAHEWGHHVQGQLGLTPDWRVSTDLVGIELEATCLEGIYAKDAYDRGLVDDTMIKTMLRMFRGDEDHGSREQLQTAFDTGFDQGLAGCGVTVLGAEDGGVDLAGEVEVGDVAAAVPANTTETARVTTAGVNLRTEPSTAAPVAGTLTPANTLRVTGPAVAGDGRTWVPVVDEATGTAGYVAEEFVAG